MKVFETLIDVGVGTVGTMFYVPKVGFQSFNVPKFQGGGGWCWLLVLVLHLRGCGDIRSLGAPGLVTRLP